MRECTTKLLKVHRGAVKTSNSNMHDRAIGRCEHFFHVLDGEGEGLRRLSVCSRGAMSF